MSESKILRIVELATREEKRIMQEAVSEMEKGFSEKIIFSFSTFRGKNYADIRIY